MAVWIKGSIKVSIKGSHNWLSDDRSYHSFALSITKHVKKMKVYTSIFRGCILVYLFKSLNCVWSYLDLLRCFNWVRS